MAATFGRGSHTVSSIFFKPMIRKAYHRKSSPPESSIRETVKMEAEEVKSKRQGDRGSCSSSSSSSWVPHERTGIYYPKGQEKVIEDVPSGAAKDIGINWFGYHKE